MKIRPEPLFESSKIGGQASQVLKEERKNTAMKSLAYAIGGKHMKLRFYQRAAEQ